jgi:prepilin-type N-terminal cleavage/methylation domain-containing protein
VVVIAPKFTRHKILYIFRNPILRAIRYLKKINCRPWLSEGSLIECVSDKAFLGPMNRDEERTKKLMRNFRLKLKKSYGFTLIELLVVISIIGLLASVVLVALNGARIKARDTKRIADNKQMMTAIELYYNDHDAYPASGGATNGPNAFWNNSTDASWASLQTLLLPYLSKLPVDPINQSGWAGNGQYSYSYYFCGGRAYMLVYKLENSASQTSPGVNACGTFYNYGGTITIGQSSN